MVNGQANGVQEHRWGSGWGVWGSPIEQTEGRHELRVGQKVSFRCLVMLEGGDSACWLKKNIVHEGKDLGALFRIPVVYDLKMLLGRDMLFLEESQVVYFE